MARPKGSPKYGGRVKGTPNKATLAKAEAREFVRQRITDRLGGMIDAHVRHSEGIGHFMLRDAKTGKFERMVTTGDQAQDEAMIDAAVSAGQGCWIYLKDPSTQSLTELLNRALDKPKEQVLEVNIAGELKMKSDAEVMAAIAEIQRKLKG